MTITDTDDLTERIARALDKNFNPGRYPIMAAMFMDYAAAILPEVEAEVRKAKAEAWEEGYDAAEINEHEHRPGRKLTNPYTTERHQTRKEKK
ncbi:hypothetical protein M3D53_09805 [Dermabacter hominis]|uniref:hypothetical protein n=1 Tax=Dermabacter hominis TaxID=36740 RepID=UPI0021A94703|nr:hypothetical protein [Dermabacter hominis]MCT2056935.1 hypothetical protein [Dermabacter hominis]MCT2084410.1 hypothetical protein [Dermabacter hominis]MCT2091759.1 hypothetical protein [Dermabacter hominis]MCT2190802.1 hypothetical protein [Dermabacter hominis]MCT2227955.1 hypothetical protein [Dermabacter hominis]